MLSLHTAAITALPVRASCPYGLGSSLKSEKILSATLKNTPKHIAPTNQNLMNIYYKLENTKYQIHLDRGPKSAVKYILSQGQKGRKE